MPIINKTIMLKSQPLNLGVFASTGEKTLSFAFEDPTLNPSNNRTASIGNAIGTRGSPYTIETTYFNIPELQNISLKGLVSGVFTVGYFDSSYNLLSIGLDFNGYFKHPNWETKLNFKGPFSKFVRDNAYYTSLFFKKWDSTTLDLLVDLSTIPQSMHNENVTLECLFTVNCEEGNAYP